MAGHALVALLSALQREQVLADAAEDLLDAEVWLSESHRLFALYTTRRQLLRNRDPQLELVASGQTWLFDGYDAHLGERIEYHSTNAWNAIGDIARLQMTSHAGQTVAEAVVVFAGQFGGGMDLDALD